MSEPDYLDYRGVAERVGVKVRTLQEARSHGRMPEPDSFAGIRPLWLPATIDAWRAERRRPLRSRQVPLVRPAPRRRRQPAEATPEQLWQRRPSGGASATSGRASAVGRRRPSVDEARALAAAVREAGFFCTSDDVLELARLGPAAELPYERELLRQRIVAKRRERSATSNGASATSGGASSQPEGSSDDVLASRSDDDRPVELEDDRRHGGEHAA